ncbi:Yip1 family protein [Paenibacillus sp. NPDC058071]|uniref:Yip1 family protein n=1 Tax=Paenibacillus sp. NPDC058071 TaxID=3346326 RepID=UPI0036D9F890
MAGFVDPWLTVWVRPRQTIRSLLDKPGSTAGMLAVTVGAGILNALERMGEKGMPFSIFQAIVGGTFTGLLMFFLFGALIKWTGQWLGGKGSHRDVRLAIAWGSYAPAILTGGIWLVKLMLFGKDGLAEDPLLPDDSTVTYLLFILLEILKIVAMFWIVVLGLKAIGEAHRFSAWKALGTIAIICAGILILLLLSTVIITVFAV